MDRVTSACFSVAAVLLTLAAGIHFTGISPLAPQTVHAYEYTYTVNESWLAAIVAWPYNWPEQKDNWCGVASIQAINAYAYHKQGIDSQNNYSTQRQMADLLNSSGATSPWGLSYLTGGFKADIAADKGTDPRSLAWGVYTATPNGYYYHNYIYPQYNGVYAATQNFASDFGSQGIVYPENWTGPYVKVAGGEQRQRERGTHGYGAQTA